MRWQLSGVSANFPMALDEHAHRLFVACRSPSRLVVLDTNTGGQVGALPCTSDADDIFRDPATNRLYVIGGGGGITVVNSADSAHYEVQATVDTASGARTGFFDSSAGLLYVACPHHVFGKDAKIRIYKASRP